MKALQDEILDFDALVARENASPIRHEYIGGRLYAMAGGTSQHAHVITNLTIAVGRRLRGKRCRASSADQRIRTLDTAKNWYYPDLSILCPPHRFHPRDKTAILNPSAIFEVLSPKTADFDRMGKFDEYAQIEELSDYVLISSEVARVEHFKRLPNGAWELRVYSRLEQELRLDNFEISVPIGEIYEDVGVGEQLELPGFEVPS